MKQQPGLCGLMQTFILHSSVSLKGIYNITLGNGFFGEKNHNGL